MDHMVKITMTEEVTNRATRRTFRKTVHTEELPFEAFYSRYIAKTTRIVLQGLTTIARGITIMEFVPEQQVEVRPELCRGAVPQIRFYRKDAAGRTQLILSITPTTLNIVYAGDESVGSSRQRWRLFANNTGARLVVNFQPFDPAEANIIHQEAIDRINKLIHGGSHV